MFPTILLLIIGTVLIVLNVKAIKREKSTFKNVLNEKSDNIKDFEIEIGKLRREFAETLLEIQKEVLELKESIKDKNIQNENNSSNIKVKNLKDDKKNISEKEIKNKEQIKDKIHESVKINEIEKQIKNGVPIEKIADNLKMSKGEILLIKELYLK